MREYTKLWLKQSLSRSLTIGDTIFGAVGFIVGIIEHYLPQWKNDVSENQWLIAIYALAAAAFGRFFIFAPYELWEVQREKSINMKSFCQIWEQKDPFISNILNFSLILKMKMKAV